MDRIQIDKNCNKPIFQQLRDQLISLIDKGVLKAGNRLPSSRELSKELSLNRSTVYKAYRELWSLGYVDSRPGSYSIVRSRPVLARNEKGGAPVPLWLKEMPPGKDCYSQHFERRTIKYDFRTFSPDPRIIPTEDFRRCYNDVMKEKGEQLLGYGHPGGYFPLIRYISELMSTHKIEASTDELMITGGAQSALHMLCRLFRKEKWKIVVEDPGYSEAIELFRSHGAEILSCPIQSDGPDLEQLQKLFSEENPLFFFTIPNYQNPTGYSSTQEKREKMLALCEEYGIPMIEDGYSQDMRGTLLSIKSMDRKHMVIYVGTFSKILFPGVRSGWIFANRLLIDRLKNLQYISHVSGNSSIQAALERFCRLGYYDTHLKRAHSLYKKRMETALTSLESHFSSDLGTFTKPGGGYYLWLSLSHAFRDEEGIYRRLIDEGIGLRPGSLSMIKSSPHPCFRLSTAHLTEEEIDEGIKEMCRILKKIKQENING